MDLTKIDQPFGTLDIETKLALHRADYEGAKFECGPPKSSSFMPFFSKPAWHPELVYRVAPEPQIDIQVPWHVFGPEVQWAARDADGAVYLYGVQPSLAFTKWMINSTTFIRIDHLHLIGFDPGNKPWDQSLVRRPEGV